MKNNFITFALLGASALMMGGCQTMRTASFPNHDYNTVFKGAVSGLCSESKLLVYKADKQNGIIWVQGRGIFANPPETPIYLTKAADGSASARVTVQGMTTIRISTRVIDATNGHTTTFGTGTREMALAM